MATATITPDQDTVVSEIFIAAPPARVFQAITDPNQMPLWWGAQGLYRVSECKSDLRVGGKWSSVGAGADGKPFRVEGEYLEIDPPLLLGAHLDLQLGGPEDRGALGTGAAERARPAPGRSAKSGHGNPGESASRRIRR